jgi:UDP-N-acetylmuramate dehydrogenase
MQDKISQRLPGVKKAVLLKDYTTYKIGGPAKYFFVAKSKEDLMLAVSAAKDFKLPVFILGGGSNLLISDKGFNGLVIKMDISGIELQGSTAFVGAGANLMKLAYLAADNGLSGLEWSAGVPGTVGGAIYGNAQAFGTKICDAIKSVEAIDIKTLKLKNFTKTQCKFSLKDSIFKENKNLVIVSAVLEFKKVSEGEPVEQIKSKIKEFLQYRKDKHPINFPSAGSVFVNPEILIKNKKLLAKFPELEEYNKKGTIPSGYLIAKSGLCGKKAGNAQISEKHCNFVVNLGGAKAKDVVSLIDLAKKKVKANFGISLETEVQFVGFPAPIKH